MKTGKTVYSSLSEMERYTLALDFIAGDISEPELRELLDNDFWKWESIYYEPLRDLKNVADKLDDASEKQIIKELVKLSNEFVDKLFKQLKDIIKKFETNENINRDRLQRYRDAYNISPQDWRKRIEQWLPEGTDYNDFENLLAETVKPRFRYLFHEITFTYEVIANAQAGNIEVSQEEGQALAEYYLNYVWGMNKAWSDFNKEYLAIKQKNGKEAEAAEIILSRLINI